jgi:DNA-binding winged helix-turn-helix (wHTH) protein/Tol biopolymer transport system component
MVASKSLVFRFDDVEVRERDFTVAKGGEKLAIEPKAFKALVFLLRNPQRVISKEELLKAVWGDVAVADGSLTRCIWLIRRILRDSIDEPRYIATVTTVGYRLICSVESFEAEPGVLEPAPAENRSAGPDKSVGFDGNRDHGQAPAATATRGRALNINWRWLLAPALLAAGVASVWWFHAPSPVLHVSDYAQVTHDARNVGLFGVDGSRLLLNVYSGSATGPAVVAETGGEIRPFPIPLNDPWIIDASRDGASILVISPINSLKRGLWSVDAMGGSARHLADGFIISAAWSPDRKQVVYALGNGDIDVVRSDGSNGSRLAHLPVHTANALMERIAWSPNGKIIRFDRDNGIYEIRSDGSAVHQFLAGWRTDAWQCCGTWTADGEFFLFLQWDSAPKAYPLIPAFQIWALDERRKRLFRPESVPVQLSSGPIRWGWPQPDRDGRRIFCRGFVLRGELERFNPQTHQPQPWLGGISAEDVSFSKDGRFIAYSGFPEGILWKANRDGSNPIPLTAPPIYAGLPRWSPDGTEILFTSSDPEIGNAGELRSFLVSAQGGPARPLPLGSAADRADPNWSPDGRKISFDSVDQEAGATKYAVRILDLATHQVERLPGQFWTSRWAPNGRLLAALSQDNQDLSIYDFSTKLWTVVQKGPVKSPSWSRDGRFIYFLGESNGRGVYRVRASGGRAELVVDLNGIELTSVFSEWVGLDPDDSPLLQRDRGSNDIYALTLNLK